MKRSRCRTALAGMPSRILIHRGIVEGFRKVTVRCPLVRIVLAGSTQYTPDQLAMG